MGLEGEEGDAFEQVANAKAKVEERLYRVSVIERILAAKDMKEEEREVLEAELSSLRHHLREAEAAIAVLQQREPRHPVAISTLIAFLGLCLYGLYRVFQLEHDVY